MQTTTQSLKTFIAELKLHLANEYTQGSFCIATKDCYDFFKKTHTPTKKIVQPKIVQSNPVIQPVSKKSTPLTPKQPEKKAPLENELSKKVNIVSEPQSEPKLKVLNRQTKNTQTRILPEIEHAIPAPTYSISFQWQNEYPEVAIVSAFSTNKQIDALYSAITTQLKKRAHIFTLSLQSAAEITSMLATNSIKKVLLFSPPSDREKLTCWQQNFSTSDQTLFSLYTFSESLTPNDKKELWQMLKTM